MKIDDDLIEGYFPFVARQLNIPTSGKLKTIDGITGYEEPFLVIEQDLNGMWSLWIVGAHPHQDNPKLRCTSYAEFGGSSTSMNTHEFWYYLKGLLSATIEFRGIHDIRFVRGSE